MDRRYKHLNSEERGVIFAEHRRGTNLRTIGSLLGRDASTISRELRRGQGDDGLYSPAAGRCCHDARRLRSRRPRRLIEGSALHTWVRGKLEHLRWSPEQIAGRLRAMHPDDPDQRVSHETPLSGHLCAAARRAESGDDPGVAAEQASTGAKADHPCGKLHGTGIIATYSSPGRDRGADRARPLGGRFDQGGVQPLVSRALLCNALPTGDCQAITKRWARWLSARPASLFYAVQASSN